MHFRLSPIRLGSSSIPHTRSLPFPSHPYRTDVLHYHTTRAQSAAASNHYETLGLPPTASQAEIKKKYYTLSKTVHPDRNPNDPNAATRFSAVSEAYSTLGNADKRTRYDRDVMRQRGPAAGRSGSYSSAQAGPNGSRPASGLSRRRSPFQGPPPSFYKSGGYGAYADRAAQAEQNAQNARRQTGQDYDPEGWTRDTRSAGGFSPGQGAQRGFDNDVPHFDRDGHYRTQETVIGKTAGRKRREYRDYVDIEAAAGMNNGAGFIIISFIVGTAIVVPIVIFSNSSTKRDTRGDG